MVTKIVTVNDGYKVTVSDILGNPMWLPTRVIELLQNAFIEETLLRDAGDSINGLVAFEKSRPLYFDDDPAEIGEFEEIPVAAGGKGTPAMAIGVENALGIRISRRMRDENKTGEVNDQIIQLVNTFIRSRARALRALLQDDTIPTIAASAAWDTSSGKPRSDIAQAQETIASASVSGDTDAEDEFGFSADTTVLPSSIKPILMDNDNFLSVYKDSLSSQDIRYTGKLERDIMGMAALEARHWPQDRVLVLERGTVGFYSDSRPLESTGLYPEGNGPNGGPRQAWRSDTSAKRTMGVDQPLAACWITGVVTP
ncbi:MAG: hypothetical protein QM638_01220 [Nocardioides sp.]|uniref:hypothetical protein n=1 Tax=Nocardioides sp. TaxID=35761 RepID=UPI0039E65BCC